MAEKLTYVRVNWEDSPSENTPINSENLNKMDSAIEAVVNLANQHSGQIANGTSGTGLTSTAISLLISILRNAIYESDQSAIITALETALKQGGSGGDTPDTPDVPVEPDKTYYSVLVTNTNCTVNSSATIIEEGGVYIAEIVPNDGHTLETVTVTMGGIDVTSNVYSDGSISITNVTGNIVVVATAMETPNDLVYSVKWNYGKRQYSATASQDNASWTSTDWFDVTEGQVLTMTLLESTEIDGVTYRWTVGNVKANEISFRNASGQGVNATIPNAYMSLNENDDFPSTQDIIVPDGAVSMCICMSSSLGYYEGVNIVTLSSEPLEGRPVWWSLVLKDGGEV